MDCLDRTNVVQSIFGRKILHQILSQFEDYSTKETNFVLKIIRINLILYL